MSAIPLSVAQHLSIAGKPGVISADIHITFFRHNGFDECPPRLMRSELVAEIIQYDMGSRDLLCQCTKVRNLSYRPLLCSKEMFLSSEEVRNV